MGAGEETLKGAAGGAATGAMIGSIVPGIGTGIGAGVGGIAGGLAGYFGGRGGDPKEKRGNFALDGYEQRRDGLNSEMGRALGVDAPRSQAAQISPMAHARGGYEWQQGQRRLAGMLEAQARGEGPSLVQRQFDSANQANIAAQASQAASGRGNQGLANLVAAQGIGSGTQQLAGQAATARMQEQMNAQGMLAGVLGQARGQDIGVNQFNAAQRNQAALQQAGFQQQANLANQDAILRNRAQQQQYAQSLRDLELRNALAQQQGNMNYALGQGPTLGDQLLAGGTNALAYGFSSGAFGKG